VILHFSLDNTTYQDSYVAFSNETYTVITGEQNLTAWLKVEAHAPPINASLTIDFKRIEGVWWNNDWQFRRRINITENSGYDLTDFPVEATFEHNGHAQLDGDDIRVIDDGTEISSCITAINNTHATFMFEIDVLASSTKSLYIYYGNPSAVAPNYSNVSLTISEGEQTGHAIIDNSVYIGWDYKIWGLFERHYCIPWTDYKIDFDENGDPSDNDDLIPDYGSWGSGIGRHRISDIGSIGLGEYQSYTQTPIYVDINFANATLRVYKNHNWVETTQADHFLMFSPSYDYANYGSGEEQNIVDGSGWNDIYTSTADPSWMAYRDSSSGNIFGASGVNIGQDYYYHMSAKEDSAYDRSIVFDYQPPDTFEPHDQPAECRIYWYGDDSNNYSKIETMAQILHNQPSILIQKELTGL